MKKFYAFILGVFLSFSAFAQDLVLSYDYETLDGGIVADMSGNGLDGTVNGDPVLVKGINGGMAIELTLDNIALPEDVTFTRNQFTFATWVKNFDYTPDEWFALFINDQGGANDFGFFIEGVGSNALVYGSSGFGAGEEWANAIDSAKWAHVAITVDTATMEIIIYRDGMVDYTGSITQALPNPDQVSKTFIGGNEDGGKNFPHVYLDETKYYDYALSPSEINALAQRSKDIVWVAGEPDSGADINKVDSALRADLIAEGYLVELYDYMGVTEQEVPLRQGQIDTLNSGDVVIITRSNYSDYFTDADGWNQVTDPIILMSGFMTRNSRLKWLNTSGLYISSHSAFTVENKLHPIFSGIEIDASKEIEVVDVTKGSGETRLVDIKNAGFGELLATNGEGYVSVAYWAKDSTFYEGEDESPVAGGDRLFLPLMFDEGSGDAGWGEDVMTADGKKLFYNSIAWLTGDLEEGSVAKTLITYFDYETATGDSGTFVEDVSGNMLDGIINGTPAVVTGKKGEQALHMVFDNIELSENSAYATNEFTFATWLNLGEKDYDEWFSLMMHDQGGANEYGVLIAGAGAGEFVFHAPGFASEEIYSDYSLDLDTWYHLALTMKAGVGVFYVNGDSVNAFNTGQDLPNPGVIAPTFFGGNADRAKDLPDGIMDETRFYSKALSAEEIELLASETFFINTEIVSSGSVSYDPSSPGNEYLAGTEVTLTATPDEGFAFEGWSGDVVSADASITVTVDSEMNLAATFGLIKYQLAVTIVGNGTTTPENGMYSGSLFLTPTPDEGSQFVAWSGDVTSTDNPLIVDMTEDLNITATFETITGINSSHSKLNSLGNFPNPFSDITTIEYSIKKAAMVELSVFDIAGKKVAVLVNTYQNAGTYQVDWNAIDGYNGYLQRGIYFCKLKTDIYISSRKMILIR